MTTRSALSSTCPWMPRASGHEGRGARGGDLARIHALFPWRRLRQRVEPATSPVRRWAGLHQVIASVTEPFCDHCNRIRITADGQPGPASSPSTSTTSGPPAVGATDEESAASSSRRLEEGGRPQDQPAGLRQTGSVHVRHWRMTATFASPDRGAGRRAGRDRRKVRPAEPTAYTSAETGRRRSWTIRV
jgi:hypothetical protein